MSKNMVIHPLLKAGQIGGGERVNFTIREDLDTEFLVIHLDKKFWSKNRDLEVVKRLYKNKFGYIYPELKVKYLRTLWRTIGLKALPANKHLIKELNQNNNVIFGGYVPGLAKHITSNSILYVHTLPDMFYPQFIEDLGNFDHIVANSEYTQELIKRKSKLDSIVIPPPIEIPDKVTKITGNYFLSTSRLDDWKRIKEVVETFQKLPKQKLVIANTGPLKNWVKLNTEEYNNIAYVGVLSDHELKTQIEGSKAGIQLSNHKETFGMSACEFLAHGRPVLTNNENAIKEFVKYGKNGIYVKDSDSTDSISEGIEEMDRLIAKTKNLNEICHKSANKYSRTNFIKEFKKLLTKLI